MGITGLLPFISSISRKAHVSEWSGCSVAIDAYCWLHRGAFACADRLARGDSTDMHIKYCMKYVNMLLARNIKPILVFDGQRLPAKAATEAKRRESRDIAKKRAAELLQLGQTEEARTYMRRSVDITHEMALQLMSECRARRVDCIVAPYEADAQLAFLSTRNIAHLVITEDSDLILFGCTKILFKMDLDGAGTFVDTSKLPLVMKCPIERYSFDKFRRMCIMSGCDYIASLPGIGLAKARQFVTSTQDPDFANALKKLPSFLNKSQLVVTDEYRENFLRAEATFKYQYVFDPISRLMVRLSDPEDEEVERTLCRDAGSALEPDAALELALGNLDPHSLRRVHSWHPDTQPHQTQKSHSQGWKETSVSKHPSIWEPDFQQYVKKEFPWRKKEKSEETILSAVTRQRKQVQVVVVPETQDDGITIENLKNMYCLEPNNKRLKLEDATSPSGLNNHEESISNDSKQENKSTMCSQEQTSPVIVNKNRSFKKAMAKSSYSVLKRLSKFPRTILDDNIVESKFFSSNDNVEKISRDFVNEDVSSNGVDKDILSNDDHVDISNNVNLDDIMNVPNSLKENSPIKIIDRKSPVLEFKCHRNPFKLKESKDDLSMPEDSFVENTYPLENLITPVDSQLSFGESTISLDQFKCSSQRKTSSQPAESMFGNKMTTFGHNSLGPKLTTCGSKSTTSSPKTTSSGGKSSLKGGVRVSGLCKRNSAPSLSSNQPTLLSKFGFQKKPVVKR